MYPYRKPDFRLFSSTPLWGKNHAPPQTPGPRPAPPASSQEAKRESPLRSWARQAKKTSSQPREQRKRQVAQASPMFRGRVSKIGKSSVLKRTGFPGRFPWFPSKGCLPRTHPNGGGVEPSPASSRACHRKREKREGMVDTQLGTAFFRVLLFVKTYKDSHRRLLDCPGIHPTKQRVVLDHDNRKLLPSCALTWKPPEGPF